MKSRQIISEIESLFARYPALSGFSVRSAADVPDNCPRSGECDELFVADIGVAPAQTSEHYGEIFHEITSTLSEILSEPGAEDLLRGRTFARTLH
ncbi:MAG TPA: hypothetical protein VD965_00315 [Burkholderiales bacterium]|nr:hypothetical protein [Burkholderiales bacterium]